MPYITKLARAKIDPLLKPLLEFIIEDVDEGNLNYIITRLTSGWQPRTYSDYNLLIGVLECAKMELYRRQVAPYEDTKIITNGDVYVCKTDN